MLIQFTRIDQSRALPHIIRSKSCHHRSQENRFLLGETTPFLVINRWFIQNKGLVAALTHSSFICRHPFSSKSFHLINWLFLKPLFRLRQIAELLSFSASVNKPFKGRFWLTCAWLNKALVTGEATSSGSSDHNWREVPVPAKVYGRIGNKQGGYEEASPAIHLSGGASVWSNHP